MVDRHDRLRHGMVARHASVGWEKSQVFEARVPSGYAETSTYRFVLLLMFLYLLLPIGEVFHLQMHISLLPHASVKFHLFRHQRYLIHRWYRRHFLLLILLMLVRQCHLLLLMLLS